MTIPILHLWLIAGGAVALETLMLLVSGVPSPGWVTAGFAGVVWFCALVTAYAWVKERA